MAEKLKEYEFRRGRRAASYPWDEWFDGNIWKLVAGDDYTSKSSSMRSAVSTAAKRAGLKVRTSIESNGNGEFIVVQAILAPKAARPKKS